LDNRTRSSGQTPLVHFPDTCANIIITETAHASQFRHRVEVANQRHPGISCRSVLAVEDLGCREKRDIDADQSRFHATTIGTNPQIAASWCLLAWLTLTGKEVVLNIDTLRRKDADFAQEERLDL